MALVGAVAPLALSLLILSLVVVWLGIPSLRQEATEQVSREENAIEVSPSHSQKTSRPESIRFYWVPS